MQHLVIVGILVIVMAVLTYMGIDAIGLAKQMNPVAASAQSTSIDWLWHWDIIAISFLFALIVVPMLYSLVVFRRKKGETGDGEHIEGNDPLEIAWTVIPLFVVVAFAYMGAYSLRETNRVAPDALVIKVKAQQFSWTFEYPEQGVFSSELHLPVDRQVVLKMESSDVIHSFWVPEFRVKQDALPGDGFERELRVTPDLIGNYKVRCAELCGRLHYDMLAAVNVVSQDDFDAWVISQTEPLSDDPVERGEMFAQQFGCIACHSLDGTQLVGPTWKGVFGSQEQLDDGTSVLVDRDYLFKSIREPGLQIVAGYQDLMPANIAEGMTDEQIEDVIAFIESLR